MALRDAFKNLISFGKPKGLPVDQKDADAPLPTFKRRRRRKTPLEKKLAQPATTQEEKDERDQLEQLAKWKTRTDRAQKLRSDWERVYEVERCERYYLGEQWDRGLRSDDLVLNHYLATIKVIKPNLIYQMPKYYVRPRQGIKSPASELRAAMSEGVLEFIGGQDHNLKRSAKLALLQSFFRIGVLKQIYDPKLEPNPRAGELMYETDEEGVTVKDQTGAPLVRMNPLTGVPMAEPDEVLTDELYRYEYVDARHVLLPDEGPDRQKWTWVGEQVHVPLADAKTDPRFPAHQREQFTSNTSPREATRTLLSSVQSVKDDEMFQYTEVYDLRKKRRLIWADGQSVEGFLVNEPLPPGLEDDPYALLVLGEPITGPVPLPWPVPFTRSWLEPQREYNIARQQIVEGGKRSARKIVYDDGTFPDADEAVKFLQDPGDMTAAKVSDVNRPPLVLPSPDINPAIYRNVPLLMQDWRVLTGQTGARLSAPESDTATEATFVERAANLRDADLQDAVNDWLGEAGQKMLQLVQGTLTLGLWIKMRGFSDKEFLRYAERYWGVPMEQAMVLLRQIPGLKDMLMARFGEERWQQVTREQLTFESEVTVVPGSSRPHNLDAERRDFMDFLRLIGQYPQLAMSRGLLQQAAAKLETIDDRMIDELVALAEKMYQMQSNIAGRDGSAGGAAGGQSPTAGNPDIAALQAGVQAGLGGGA